MRVQIIIQIAPWAWFPHQNDKSCAHNFTSRVWKEEPCVGLPFHATLLMSENNIWEPTLHQNFHKFCFLCALSNSLAHIRYVLVQTIWGNQWPCFISHFRWWLWFIITAALVSHMIYKQNKCFNEKKVNIKVYSNNCMHLDYMNYFNICQPMRP